MPLKKLKDRLYKSKKFDDIISHLDKHSTVRARGLSYSLQSFFIAKLFEENNKKILYLADSVESCEKMRDDLLLVLDENTNVEILLPAENYAYSSSDIDDERKGNRLIALEKIYAGSNKIVVSTYKNLFEKLPLRENFTELNIFFEKGKELKTNSISETLTGYNFEKVTTVENIGEFSVKGNIIDIYPLASEYPVRIELFGDEIYEIRYFDPADQRRVESLENLTIYLSDAGSETNESANLLELISDTKMSNSVVFIDDCDDIELKLNDYFKKNIIEGYNRLTIDENKIHYDEKYFTTNSILSLLENRKVIYDLISDDKYDVKINIKDQGSYRYDFKTFLTSLKNNDVKGYYSYILCDNPGQAERFIELLDEGNMISSKLRVVVGGFHSGFIYPESKIAVYTDHQIFGRVKRPKNFRRFKKVIPLKELKRLSYGDYIVHIDHGIGKFLGMEKITVAGSVRDVIKLKYRDNDILYVKLDHIQMIQKYSASEGIEPTLSKIGGKQFKATKERTKKSIKSIARELIKLYAERKQARGFAFALDNVFQTEMEASFEFTDTPDQTTATADIKKDMESEMPMDRLVCGDVGFGKTEVAIRAAFKAINGGKQVAVLAPTTILVHQHFENFKKRIERYPVKIGVLSRFRTKHEQGLTSSDIRTGKVDIVIGTHRLLSKDIEFKNLGLLIVDEEQRFGVSHKERIKEFKVNVDVLTLTATPIPRTLHMSLMGVRDLSLINTPPTNRLPIITEVHTYNDDIIFEAIMKEYDRGGQVFFVHNRVESIMSIKHNLERVVPDVSVAVAHGQMKPKELEGIMYDFMLKKYDVLIATTIIENGVDIPNVNTLIVNKANMFGLSQLYQLRGRIGRSNRQAFAYFLTPPMSSLTDIARKRLDTVSEFTDLGSGFQIAMKDLEIRGSGSLLGSEQSGYIENVGFDLYTSILEEAVQELKTEEFNEVLTNIETKVKIRRAAVNLKNKMYLPNTYISENSERVEIYRRMMDVKNLSELKELKSEILDRFGFLPREAKNLFDNVVLSIMGGRVLLKSITLMEKDKDEENWFIKFTFNLDEFKLEENKDLIAEIQKFVQRISFATTLTRKDLRKLSDEQIKEVEEIKRLNINVEKSGEWVFFYPKARDKEIDLEKVENVTEAINKTKFEFVKKCLVTILGK